MTTNTDNIDYYIELDTRTGVTVPIGARSAILAAAGLDPALAQSNSWAEELLAPAYASYGVEVEAGGSTKLRSFRAPLTTARELAMLEAFIQHGGAGQNAVLWAQADGGGLRGSLFECTGTGTAARHESAIVFPTYAGSTSVPGSTDDDDPVMDMQDALRTRRAATPAYKAPRRASRLESHAGDPTAHEAPEAAAAACRAI